MINTLKKTLKRFAFISLFIVVSFFTQAQVNLDSLWVVWNDETAPDTSRTKAMHKIAIKGYLYSQPDSAFYFAQMLYDFANKKGLKKMMGNAVAIQGGSYYNRSDYDKALNYDQQSLKIYEEISNKSGIASLLNNIGNVYSSKGDYAKALDYYLRSLKFYEETSDKKNIAAILNNIGVIYYTQSNYPKALEYYQRSLKIREEISDKRGIGNLLNNLGAIYRWQGDHPKALEYYQRGLEISEEISDKKGIGSSLDNIGTAYEEQGDYPKALDYYQRSLKIYEEISNKRGMASTFNNIGSINNEQGDHAQAIFWCKKALYTSEEIDILLGQKYACQCLYDAYKAMGNGNQALKYHEKMLALDDSLQSVETSKLLQQMEFAKQVLADSLIQVEQKLKVQIAHEAEVRKKNQTKNIFILSALFFLIAAGVLYSRIKYIRRAKTVIEKEKDRSDELLLNILPAEIAEELKEKGRADAKNFEMVSILFTDFKEFTQTSEKLSAKELVGEINVCFEAFDATCGKYGIEKIKTIGDSYMAAGGLLVLTDDSIKNSVLAGLEMVEFMINRKKEREDEGNIPFEMRVGIHTGPVVAGIVGVKKFQYDIWGDTVNTASRMENSGEVGKVNISQSTYEFIKEDPIFKFQARGKIKTKGKGEIDMYFVESITLNEDDVR